MTYKSDVSVPIIVVGVFFVTLLFGLLLLLRGDGERGVAACMEFSVRIEHGHPAEVIERIRIQANHRLDVAERQCVRGARP